MILGTDPSKTLEVTEAAVAAMRLCPDVILPFPGGIARSGSKVGSKYRKLRASTNAPFNPLLRGHVKTELPAEVRCVYEIVIDGLTLEAVEYATWVGLEVASHGEVVQLSAGNYGGNLGPFHIRLHDLVGRHSGFDSVGPLVNT